MRVQRTRENCPKATSRNEQVSCGVTSPALRTATLFRPSKRWRKWRVHWRCRFIRSGTMATNLHRHGTKKGGEPWQGCTFPTQAVWMLITDECPTSCSIKKKGPTYPSGPLVRMFWIRSNEKHRVGLLPRTPSQRERTHCGAQSLQSISSGSPRTHWERTTHPSQTGFALPTSLHLDSSPRSAANHPNARCP